MDAIVFLLAFAGATWGLWALGAHGLAITFAGCGIWAGLVEAWYYVYRGGDTVSKETGRIWGQSRLRFYAILALVGGGALGLVVHLQAMAR